MYQSYINPALSHNAGPINSHITKYINTPEEIKRIT